MNIKKITSNRPLLTIDDPTIYQQASGTYKDFVNVATGTNISEIGSDSDTLYLIGTDATHLEPYVWCMDGTYRKMPNPFSKGPTLPYPTLSHGDSAIYQLNDNLVAIDNHLYALRKELSYWNLYKISYSVDKADDFSATLSSIAPGEALIINIDGLFSYEGQQYSRGDLILRLIDGTYITVKASTSGFYYPSRAVQENRQITLYYSYWQENTVDESMKEITSVHLDKPYQTEYINIELASAADSFIYAERFEMNATSICTFQAYNNPNNNQPIPPIVKFFTQDGEEIALDFTCEWSSMYEFSTEPGGTGPAYTIEIPGGTQPSKPSMLQYAYIK